MYSIQRNIAGKTGFLFLFENKILFFYNERENFLVKNSKKLYLICPLILQNEYKIRERNDEKNKYHCNGFFNAHCRDMGIILFRPGGSNEKYDAVIFCFLALSDRLSCSSAGDPCTESQIR